MLRVTLPLLALALAIAPSVALASGGTVDKCVFGNAGICVIANGNCVGVGFGLQGVGACQYNGCAFVFLGFNQIGTCGGVLSLP